MTMSGDTNCLVRVVAMVILSSLAYADDNLEKKHQLGKLYKRAYESKQKTDILSSTMYRGRK